MTHSTVPRIILRHLVFTGFAVKPARLPFEDGLNILYGASNTGKSFTLKALNFMLGGNKPLPGIEQRRPYDSVYLGLSLPDQRDMTLYRAASGGNFLCFPGLHESRPEDVAGTKLAQKKQKGGADPSVSQFLLNEIGLTGRHVVKNSNGEKEALSFRHLAPYLFVDESDIIDERSPVLSGQFTLSTVEKNVFKLLLTGRDDSGVVPTSSSKTVKAARLGKVELVDELLRELEREMGENGALPVELAAQDERLQRSLSSLQETVKERQQRLDQLVQQRREAANRIADASERLSELNLTVARFAKLDDVYRSDLARLEAIEEGGALLATRLGRACLVCGAPPEHQKHTHGADEIRRAHQAAAAELRKINLERRDLTATMASLQAEAQGLRKRIEDLEGQQTDTEAELERERPLEASSRREYETLYATRESTRRLLDLAERRDELLRRKNDLTSQPSKPNAPTLDRGIDGATADAFALKVQQVLEAWSFPGDSRVSFDLELQDIRIDGKERAANGKGVRALLHAAFKIAALLFCRERELPHPGFVVLDSPLLTYRAPFTRHGELTADEKVIAATGLNESFYQHLASLGSTAQIIVIENSDPPESALRQASVTVFTGQAAEGRAGFF